MVFALREPHVSEGTGLHSWPSAQLEEPRMNTDSRQRTRCVAHLQGATGSSIKGGNEDRGAGRRTAARSRQSGSTISRRLEVKCLSVPSLSGPPALQGSHQEFIRVFIGSWHLQLETPPSVESRSSVYKITKLLGFQFFPGCSRPLGTSSLSPGPLPTTVGEGADRAHSPRGGQA